MLISLNWLRDFVESPVDVQVLAERLTLAGNEVERVHQQELDVAGVVVAEVEALRPLPGSTKNQIATITSGNGSSDVVTGAWNLSVGDKVPYATPGSRLGQRRIETKTFLGFPSAGMLCSAVELGLGDDATGIMILDAGAALGADLLTLYPRDTILELEIKSNRPDLLCHLGIAREIGAIFSVPFRRPAGASDHGSEAPEQVRIEAPDGCRRFVARRLTGIKVGPSPAWMQARLRAVGLRPISNVVDVTNYVMFETGQPMHAFDARRLAGARLIARRARDGEQLLCLDGKIRSLSVGDMVVADEERPQALAGIIGGMDSAVQAETNEVILEAATWEPRSVRASARRAMLRTEASLRFEKGLSPELGSPAVDRASALLAELADARAAASTDVYPGPLQEPVIQLNTDRIERLLGVDIDVADATSILQRLEFKVAARDGSLQVRPPAFRLDCAIPEDVVEEIGRIYGYDRLPSTLPGERTAVRDLYDGSDVDEVAREVLAGREIDEAVTESLVSRSSTPEICLPGAPATLLRIDNPMAENRDALRRSLLPGLLQALAFNARQDREGARLFELGWVYWRTSSGGIDEPRVLGLAAHVPSGGRDAAVAELRAMQTTLSTVRDRLALRATDFQPADAAGFHPGRVARIVQDGSLIGVVGEVHPAVLEQLDLPGRAIAAEVWFDRLTDGGRTPQAHPLPRFPGVRRDLTVVITGQLAGNDLVQVIRQLGGYTLREVSMLAEYVGPQLGPDARSLSFRLFFQADDRTLTNEEVSSTQQRIVDGLKQRFQAEVRS
jgi:phenylalanyl-tRNA synthetase beta chain